MKITFHDGLPFVSAIFMHQKQFLTLEKLLLDTGSSGTLISTTHAAQLGLSPNINDVAQRIVGVGGAEFVYEKRVDKVTVGDLEVRSFKIEIGAVNYEIEMDGILGIDFLRQTKAVIDLANLELRITS